MDFLPSWTTPGHWSLGRDPLGMQATSVRMYRRLVPGLTNVTNRLRYYAFYAFVIERFTALEYQHPARWRHFIRRAEALYALSCNVADQSGAKGLAGNEWAAKILKDEKILTRERFDLTPFTDEAGEAKQYLSKNRSNFSQFFIASMLDEGFLLKSRGVPIVSARGDALAKAFGSSIGELADLFLDAVRSGSVATEDIGRIGGVVHPSRIPDGSDEMRLLRAFATGESPAGKAGLFRRASGQLALRLCRAGVVPFDEDVFRWALYNGALPDGSSLGATDAVSDLWRAYQANELCHIALEAILNALVRSLDTQSTTRSPDHLIAATLAPALTELGATERSFASVCETLGMDAIGREEKLAARILAATTSDKADQDHEVVGDAIALVAALALRWGADAPMRQRIAHFTGERGRSLSQALGTLDALEDSPATDALVALVRRHVVLDHLMIAGRKLAAKRSTFTYRFTSIDGVLEDGRRTTYTYTNPRLTNLVRFLEDAGLHHSGTLTSVGDAFLDGKPLQ